MLAHKFAVISVKTRGPKNCAPHGCKLSYQAQFMRALTMQCNEKKLFLLLFLFFHALKKLKRKKIFFFLFHKFSVIYLYLFFFFSFGIVNPILSASFLPSVRRLNITAILTNTHAYLLRVHSSHCSFTEIQFSQIIISRDYNHCRN